MTQSTQLANRVREVFLNGAFVANTNYKAQLDKIDLQKATAKVKNLNTIAALTFHINYYVQGLIEVFEGGPLAIHDKYSFDMSPVATEADWQKMKNTLLTNAEKFATHVEKMSDDKLQSVFIDPKYGNYQRNIEAIIEHAYYHLGQISLIAKM